MAASNETHAPPSTSSKAAVAGGVGGFGVVVYLIDRLLADDGQVAATMLTKLSPVLGPIWASYPVLALLIAVAWLATDKWKAAQSARAAEAEAAAGAAAALTASVGEVATGLTGLRSEVHELRGALQDHATATDERLRHHEVGLGQLKAEVTTVRGRVDALERPSTRRPRRA